MKVQFEYKGYFGSVQLHEIDAVFHGRILLIRDLVTFEGADLQELRRNLGDHFMRPWTTICHFVPNRGTARFHPQRLHEHAADVRTSAFCVLTDAVHVCNAAAAG
jgi:hypothetical protein